MMEFFLILLIAIFLTLVFLLIGICLHHAISDKYDMSIALDQFKEVCKVCDITIKEVTDIVEKMKNCPIIGQNVKPIKVYENGNLYAYIVGNSIGEPRFFAFNKGDNRRIYDVERLRLHNNSFKEQGLKHSISAEQLKEILDNTSKANFKIKLEKEQEKNIYKHFNG